jgi:serine/threonine protein kinase
MVMNDLYHEDLNLGNMIVTPTGIRVIDFGLSSFISEGIIPPTTIKTRMMNDVFPRISQFTSTVHQ